MKARLTVTEVEALDPYAFMAVLGKHVIHPGGRRSTEELFRMADLKAGQRVLEVGCGVGTTAIEIARRFGCHVTAVDIAPLMLDRARANIHAAGLDQQVATEMADVQALPFQDQTFDRVIIEAVTMFVNRPRAVQEVTRVCRMGGLVLDHEFVWHKPPSSEAYSIFTQDVCPGIQFSSQNDLVELYRNAGLRNIRAVSGPFSMITPAGFLRDEGLLNSLSVMVHSVSRWCYLKKMAWLMPRMIGALPYLGYVVVAGERSVEEVS